MIKKRDKYNNQEVWSSEQTVNDLMYDTGKAQKPLKFRFGELKVPAVPEVDWGEACYQKSVFNKTLNCTNSSPGGDLRVGFCTGEPTVRLPECNYPASVICHSFDTKTAKYFLLVCNHVSLFSPVSWQPNITPRAKRTEIQYYKPPPPSPRSLPNYHPSPWKPFGWVSNHSNLHLRCLKTCSPWRRRGARLHGNGTRCSLRLHLHEWEFADIWALCKSLWCKCTACLIPIDLLWETVTHPQSLHMQMEEKREEAGGDIQAAQTGCSLWLRRRLSSS